MIVRFSTRNPRRQSRHSNAYRDAETIDFLGRLVRAADGDEISYFDEEEKMEFVDIAGTTLHPAIIDAMIGSSGRGRRVGPCGNADEQVGDYGDHSTDAPCQWM